MVHKFFYTFLITVIIVRVYMFYIPLPSTQIRGKRVHHYVYGAIGIVISLLLKFWIIFALSLALFVDELGFLLFFEKSDDDDVDHKNNYSLLSIVCTAIFVIIVFYLRNYLVLPFL